MKGLVLGFIMVFFIGLGIGSGIIWVGAGFKVTRLRHEMAVQANRNSRELSDLKKDYDEKTFVAVFGFTPQDGTDELVYERLAELDGELEEQQAFVEKAKAIGPAEQEHALSHLTPIQMRREIAIKLAIQYGFLADYPRFLPLPVSSK